MPGELVAAVAREPVEASRVPVDKPAVSQVVAAARPCTDQRHPTDVEARQHDCAATDRRPVPNRALAEGPVRVSLERPVGIDGTWVLVVEQHHARSEEDAVLEVEPMENEYAVLKLAVVSDPHLLLYLDPLPQHAVDPDP